MFNCPPIRSDFSKTVTLWPRCAAVMAAAIPAAPAPTTATRRGTEAGAIVISVSWHARGLTKHEDILPLNVWSKHAWLHAIHGAIWSACPAIAFATKSASARNGRAIDTMSAQPSANTPSATSGELIRFEVMTGIDTSPINFCVTQVNARRGTEVAIVGTRASCQPIPVLIIVAYFSTSRASCTTSSQVEPFGIRSIMLSR